MDLYVIHSFAFAKLFLNAVYSEKVEAHVQPATANSSSFIYQGYSIEIRLGHLIRVGAFVYRPIKCIHAAADPSHRVYQCEIWYPTSPDELMELGIKNPDHEPQATARQLAEGIIESQKKKPLRII